MSIVRAMDVKLIQGALAGLVPIEALSIPERIALARAEVLQISLTRKKDEAPVRFLLPAAIERLYRGCAP